MGTCAANMQHKPAQAVVAVSCHLAIEAYSKMRPVMSKCAFCGMPINKPGNLVVLMVRGRPIDDQSAPLEVWEKLAIGIMKQGGKQINSWDDISGDIVICRHCWEFKFKPVFRSHGITKRPIYVEIQESEVNQGKVMYKYCPACNGTRFQGRTRHNPGELCPTCAGLGKFLREEGTLSTEMLELELRIEGDLVIELRRTIGELQRERSNIDGNRLCIHEWQMDGGDVEEANVALQQASSDLDRLDHDINSKKQRIKVAEANIQVIAKALQSRR
jgi:hypothetical protein